MMVELLLFSVEKNVFASSHDARAVTDDHVTTTRRPDLYSCAFGDVTCRKVMGFYRLAGTGFDEENGLVLSRARR